MFKKLFGGSNKPEMRPPADPSKPYLEFLRPEDIERVVAIIDQTDEDDAADAQDDLSGPAGLENMFGLWYKGEIVGVTGYNLSEASADVVWLSWTYVDDAVRGDGAGKYMVEELLAHLNQKKVRKIFIPTSDYIEDGEPLYADAHAFYKAVGASLELTIPNFYAPGENMLVYGLENPGMAKPESFEGLGERGVRFLSVEPDDEGEGVGNIAWEETEDGSVEGIDRVIGLANSRGYRLCLAALPADISDQATGALELDGFQRLGVLEDFYALELSQVWWAKSLP